MVFFNLALSIKGGAMMWLPGFLFILGKIRGILTPLFFLLFTIAFQIAIGYPFLIVNSKVYFERSFGLDRRLFKSNTVLYFLFFDDETF
jgi:Gpi18-like mannosyltransferase